MRPTVVEICAGGGGQSLGLELAGLQLVAAVEIQEAFCQTLALNRPHWKIINADVRNVDGTQFRGVDVFAGGVPCPPFSIAGKQRGHLDERDLFPTALRFIREMQPKAVLLENVSGFATPKFAPYRDSVLQSLRDMGYGADWRILNAAEFGVPQKRSRFILVAMREPYWDHFAWPIPRKEKYTVAQSLVDLMGINEWSGISRWYERAGGIAPTLVGGSMKHGGPDLGPTRARAEWRVLGVDGSGIAETAPPVDFPVDGFPRLTVRMAARVQGFPDSWNFFGRKTSVYKQIGNAFPPPVAEAVGKSIVRALSYV